MTTFGLERWAGRLTMRTKFWTAVGAWARATGEGTGGVRVWPKAALTRKGCLGASRGLPADAVEAAWESQMPPINAVTVINAHYGVVFAVCLVATSASKFVFQANL